MKEYISLDRQYVDSVFNYLAGRPYAEVMEFFQKFGDSVEKPELESEAE